MHADADVLIIGGGIIGCATARELARRGANVRLFEARAVAAGATHASAGVLAPYIEGHERGPLFDLMLRSLTMYDGWIADVRHEAGIDIEYVRCGTLEIANDEAAAERLRAAALSSGPSATSRRWLDGDAARAAEPSLPRSIYGAILEPLHAYVAVSMLTEALAWAAVRHGVEVETHRKISGIAPDGERLRLTAFDGSTWSAQWVVAAAGSWTGQMGLTEPAARNVRPVRGQLIRLAWTGHHLSHILWGPDCYVVPWRDGTALVGATVEEVGFDERTTAAGVRDLLDAVCELLPEAWAATFLEARAGLRPATSDGLPIVGPSDVMPGVVYATGHYRNGVLLAPLTAALVADYILDGRSDPALQILHPGRFPKIDPHL